MKRRSLITLTFCLVLPTVALRAQENSKGLTDEEDARVATVAARQSAITTLLASGDQSRDDGVKAARAWNRAGRFQLLLNTPDDAIATYRKALDVLRNTNDVQTRVESLNGLAAVYKHMGKYAEANLALDRAIRLSNRNGYVEGKAEALLIRPFCITNKVEALQDAEESLELWKSTNQKLGQAKAYMIVGEYQMIQNNLAEAGRNYETAQKLWEELNVPNQVAEALINLGFIEYRKGAWQSSLSFYIQAQQLIIDEAAEPYMMGQMKAGLAEAFIEIGVPSTGLDRYREALEYYRQMKSPGPVAGMQWGIGTAHYYIGNYAEALGILKTTRAEAIALKHFMLAALCDDFTGRSYYELQDYPAALRHYQAALDGFTKSGNPMEAARSLALMGQVYQKLGNFQSAQTHYQRALASFQKLSDQVNSSATLYALGSLELEQNSVDAAEEHLRQSIEMTEAMRRVSLSSDLTAAFSARIHDRYEKYIDCMMRKYQSSQAQDLVKDAFQTSELSRARSLAELLHATQANLFPGLDPQLAAQEKTLRGYLNDNENAKIRLLSGKFQTSELKALESEYQQLKAQHDQLLQDIRRRNPSYEQVIRPTAWDLRKIQEQVIADDQTVLLEFSLGSEKSYLWAVTRSGIQSYELPSEQTIEPLARRVHRLLSTPPRNDPESDLSSATEDLARVILWPAREHLNKQRIIVVADGVLNYIPFQILPSSSSNKLLVDEAEIINAPSASTFGELQEEAVHRQPATNLLAAFGDPVFAADYQLKDSEQVIAAAQLRSALRDNDLNNETFDPTAMTRLFHAKRELDSLGEVAGEKALIVREYDATRDRFLHTDLTQFAILHLVTHGYFNPKHPQNSGFVLSDIDRDQKHRQGFVGLRDIYELRAPVLLVVLSACQTALGENVRGEGLMGMTRGFMHAGASSVVASLWEVDDRATAELMKLFYSNMLKRGMKTGEALRAAQNSIRQRPEWRSPHYWAAFTLQGEYPRAIQGNSETGGARLRSTVIVVITLLVLSGLLFWIWRRKTLRAH
ncbi:MAG TPA: CHAT domain-containing tetratricopeptide repeat protein [Pyrinomonadaceae bacterium]|nr:CHAT domain-containing tetratricopeptide repeat protein [Pyrinomonadaceae bacterium]